MAKYLSNKERKQKLLYKKIKITILCVLLVIIGLAIVNRNKTPNTTYTAEQMLHDHDGDGIPDH